MKATLITAAALVAGVQALVGRGSSCCFQLKSTDGATVGQLSDGQNRLYGNLAAAEYCISSTGGITDGK